MASVRTVLVTISPLLATLVIDLLRPALSLDLIGDLPTRDGLIEQLCILAPDLVLLGLQAAEPDEFIVPLLARVPAALFLAIAPNGQHVWMHELRPYRAELKDLCASQLIKAVTARFLTAPPPG